MATKKQIFLPLGILALTAAISAAVLLNKPEIPQKEPQVPTPMVDTDTVLVGEQRLAVRSYGNVAPKYETELVSQISGEVIWLNEKFARGGFISKGEVLAKVEQSDYLVELQEAKAAVASSKANLIQERANSAVAEREWRDITHSTPTALSLRKPQLAQAQAQLDSAKAKLERAQRNLARTIITSPFDALVQVRSIGLGAFVSRGTPIGQLLSISTAQVRLAISPDDLALLDNEGLNAPVTLTSNGNAQQQWMGKIIRNEGVIDPSTRMNYLIAEVPQPYNLQRHSSALKLGSYVQASIEGKKLSDSAKVPRYLIDNNQIALLSEDQTLLYQPVSIVYQSGDFAIVQGLSPNSQMITSAIAYPVEGMQLARFEDNTPINTVVEAR